MKIIVCVKQVPDTTEIKIDPVTNTLIRAGVPSIVNPYDAYALETALRLKERYGAEVLVISMGPEQAKEALKECLAVGADRAWLISDRAFGGSDTLATSFVLSRAVAWLSKELGDVGLILCGKQAIDGDTAQVGPEMAEHLDLPQITYASDAELSEDGVLVKRENDDGYDMIKTKLPAVVTVTKISGETRLINPQASEKTLAKMTTLSTVIVGLIALILSLQFSSIISLLSMAYTFMTAGGLVMIAGGILWKKGTTQGAIASFLIGIACVIVNKMGVQMPIASIFPILPSLIAYVAVSLMTQPKKG